MGKIDYKVFSIAIFTISVLMISGAAQNVYAGGGFSMHVWSGGGANDDWDNSDNWYAGNTPESTETLSHGTIYIGCDFAPTPGGEGPAPTNVNVLLGADEGFESQTIVSPDNDGLMLCAGSTLTVEDDMTLNIVPFVPESPITVSHTNPGNLIIVGEFNVQNTFANDDDVTVRLVNTATGTITVDGTDAEFKVQNTGAVTGDGSVFLDVRVLLDNDGTITITDAEDVKLQNTGAVTDTEFTTEVVVRLDNDGTMIVDDEFTMQNTGAITNDMGDGIDLDIIVDNDDDADITVGGTFTMQNTGATTVTDPDEAGEGEFGGGNEVNVKFEENDGTLTILDDGSVRMLNSGIILGDHNPDLDIEFDDNDGTIDIKSGGTLLMQNTADLTKTDDSCVNTGEDGSPDCDAQVAIQFDDNHGSVLVAAEGTLEMLNSGDVEGPCETDISIEFNENNGLIDVSGTILMENTGDSTDTDCVGDSSEIEVEIENDTEEGGDATITIQEDGTFTLKNSGDAEIIDVELQNEDEGLVTNRGTFNIENTGDATEELQVGIDNNEESGPPGTIDNHCNAVINIENSGGADTEEVGVSNGGTINNFGTGTITVDDDGDVTENAGIAVVGDPINFLATCQGGPLPDVYVVMGTEGNTDPENGSLATADINTDEPGLLTQVGAAIAPIVDHGPTEGFYDGLSGLAIDSNGRFFVTAVVQEDFPSRLLQINPLNGEIITNVGPTEVPPEGDDTGAPMDVRVRDLSFQPGTNDLFGVGIVDDESSNVLFTIDTSDATIEIVNLLESTPGGSIKGLAFAPDGTLYGTNCGEGGNLFTLLTATDDDGFDQPELVTSLDRCYDGLGIDKNGNIYGTSQDLSSLHLIDTSDGSDITVAGEGTNPSDVDFRDKSQITGGNNEDNAPYPRPNLGDGRYGGGHDNGFCMDQNCMDVRSNYYNHFPETTVNQGSTHTFTLLVSCQRGADTCIHASIGGALPDSTFYDTRWDASLDKDIMTGEWTLTVTNDHGEIGTVTGTVQTVGETFIQVTFNIQFLIPSSVGTHEGEGDPHENNRHLHVTLWDNQRGMSNYIFNEGMFVEDIYAYPVVDMSFDAALEYEPLCLNEDSTMRYTCAFDKVKDWTIQQAEEKLKEMYDQRGQDMDSYDESEQN